MSMIYQFRILSDQCEDFLLDLEIPYHMNLSAFNDYLQQQLGYDPRILCSFFVSDVEWEKLQEYTQEDMSISAQDMEYSLCEECDVPQPMSSVRVSDIVCERFDRLVYVFDPLCEHQLYIELLRSLVPEPGVFYPRVVSRSGSAPLQDISV